VLTPARLLLRLLSLALSAACMVAYAPNAAASLQLATRLDAVSGIGTPWLRPPTLELRAASSLRPSLIADALVRGSAMLGTRYELGADRSDAVDCSAMVRRMFSHVGIALPRTTRQQLAAGRPVPLTQIQPGDLLFYRFRRRGLHVAVYLANGRVLHASTHSGQVAVSALTATWTRRFVSARRLL
jgi:cell wall-associated NlpC family hydrolase